jgi:hypothetical protein
MSLSNSDKIRQICRHSAGIKKYADGTVGIDDLSPSGSIMGSGLRFHDIEFEALQVACVEVLRTLHPNGRIMILSSDHKYLWSWCLQLIINNHRKCLKNNDGLLKMVFTVSALCLSERPGEDSGLPPARDRTEFMARARARSLAVDSVLGARAQEVLEQTSGILSYIVFPFLEAVLKKSLSNFVGMDGEIRKTFQKFRSGRKPYKIGDWPCSSLLDLLFLFECEITDNNLKCRISEYKLIVEELYPGKSAFETIYKFRNQSLHGTEEATIISGIILNLIFLIVLQEISADYETARVDAAMAGRAEVERRSRAGSPGRRPFFSVYPPG